MTLEKIKEIGKTNLGRKGVKVEEMQLIYKASNKNCFWMIIYAYALGFVRASGQIKS